MPFLLRRTGYSALSSYGVAKNVMSGLCTSLWLLCEARPLQTEGIAKQSFAQEICVLCKPEVCVFCKSNICTKKSFAIPTELLLAKHLSFVSPVLLLAEHRKGSATLRKDWLWLCKEKHWKGLRAKPSPIWLCKNMYPFGFTTMKERQEVARKM